MGDFLKKFKKISAAVSTSHWTSFDAEQFLLVLPAHGHLLPKSFHRDGFPQGSGEDGMDDFRVKQFEKCKRPDQIACRPEKSAAFLFPRSRFPDCQFFGSASLEKNCRHTDNVTAMCKNHTGENSPKTHRYAEKRGGKAVGAIRPPLAF
ncbi:MAG: hypothetical protein IJH79_15425 [Lentisphaeria bacterium]|nr:hypothetical protein [Lentisphaeria bacterium]